MKYRIVLLDETEYWREDIAKQAGKIFGVYFFNPAEVTHLCELTPSYALWPLSSVAENLPEDEDEREVFYQNMEDGDSCERTVKYFHCHTIDSMPQIEQGEIARGWYEIDYEIPKYFEDDDPMELFEESWNQNPDY